MCSQALQTVVAPLRAYGPVVLDAVDDPHAEVMALVWGPRFDREHAMGLVARQPSVAAHTLPALLAAADHFDALHAGAQGRLRWLIVRHRALCAAGASVDEPRGERA